MNGYPRFWWVDILRFHHENETFLRWLLIERAKYFRRFPERRKKGWYVCKSDEISEGKRFYLDYLGFEMVTLENYEEIYKGLLEV